MASAKAPAIESIAPNSLPANDLSPGRTIFVACFGIVAALLFCSPNYDFSKVDRLTPLGSDFLQEWTGGYIWASESRSELYSAEHFQAIQHDASIVGFNWPESQYYPMVYPPFYYLLLSPLAILPYWVAVIIWMSILAAISGSTIWMWCKYYPPAHAHWGKCLFATIAFFPFLMSLNTAHKSVVLLFVLCASYLLLRKKRPFQAGLTFGLIAFKPHLGILIGVAMLLKRQWNFVAGCLASVSLLVGLSFLAGADLCQDYFWQCLSMSDYSNNGGYLFAESHNLVGAIGLTFGPGSLLGKIVCFSLALGIITGITISLRGGIDTSSQKFAFQFSILVLATILLSPHFYIYDLTIVLLPLGLIAFQLAGRFKEWRLLAWLCVGLFAISGVSTMIAERIHVQPTILIMLGLIVCLTQLCQQMNSNPK